MCPHTLLSVPVFHPCVSPVCVSEVRGGALSVGHMLLSLGEALQSLPAAEGSQLLHATGSIPAGKVLRGAQQVRTHGHTHTHVNVNVVRNDKLQEIESIRTPPL